MRKTTMNIEPTFHNPHPITILEARVDAHVAELSRLGCIIAALRSIAASSHLGEIISAAHAPEWITPTFKDTTPTEHKRFLRAVRVAKILADRDAVVARAWQAFTRVTSPKPATSPTDSFQGLHSVTATRIAEVGREEDGLTVLRKAPSKVKDKSQRFSRCSECGEPFVDGKGRPTPSPFEFCGESKNVGQMGVCKQEWLQKHLPACKTRRTEAPITFDEHISRASYRPSAYKIGRVPTSFTTQHTSFPMFWTVLVTTPIKVKAKSQSTFWCKACVDYREQVHECTPGVKLQLLSANLMGVRNLPKLQVELRDLYINRPAPSFKRWSPQAKDWMSDDAHVVIMEERASLIVRNYEPRVIDYKFIPMGVDFLREHGTGEGKPFINDWKFTPPPPFSFDRDYLKWAAKTYLTTPVQAWWAEQCLCELIRLNMPLVLRDYNASHVKNLGNVSDARQMFELLGARRVNSSSRFRKADCDWAGKGDSNSRDFRANLIFKAQDDSKAKRTPSICKRKACGQSFVAVRKGHEHCTENCRKRDWEEMNNQGEN
jgi:hypothetical protein